MALVRNVYLAYGDRFAASASPPCLAALLNSKPKKPHGLGWLAIPRPKARFLGRGRLLVGFLSFGISFEKAKGAPPSLRRSLSLSCLPHGESSRLVQPRIAPIGKSCKCIVLRRAPPRPMLSNVHFVLLKIPRCFAHELSFLVGGRNRLSRRRKGSAMCDRYDRSTRTQELIPRCDILQNTPTGGSPLAPYPPQLYLRGYGP